MNIVHRLTALGLSAPTAAKLEALVAKWVSCSGPEWTVKRLKGLKVELINRLAGSQAVVPWVRRNSDGLPQGPISELFRIAEKSQRGATIAINSLMVYSSFVAEKVTEVQRKKFYESMKSTDKTGLKLTIASPFWSPYGTKLGEFRPWTNVSLSSESFQPGPDGKSYPETETLISFTAAILSDPIMQMIRKYSSIFNRVVPVALMQDLWREGTLSLKYDRSSVNLCVGKISYIQEPGFKLRAVANPNRVVQAALEPLKEALNRVIRKLPNDFTFDQDAGVKRVQGWLQRGKMVHSIDLSDATNLFPLTYQVSVLRKRISVPWSEEKTYASLIDLFADVAKAPWFSKEDGVVEVHSFTRGQPLGLGPSFFTFGISHNLLISDLCDSLLVSKDCFAVLGDDVCISNELVANAYRSLMTKLGCKIAEEKSLASNRVAEFAGKVIFSDKIIPQFKWREVSDANVIDFCRNLGPKSVHVLSSKQRRLVDALAKVPDFLGGLGWNPEGLPLADRLRDPFVSHLLTKDISVSLPFRRVDRGLISFMRDMSSAVLSPSHLATDGNVTLIPSKGKSLPSWASPDFWSLFTKAQESVKVLPEEISVESIFASVQKQGFKKISEALVYYTPYFKDDGDPRASKRTPWFEIVRYFERNNSRIDSNLPVR